MLYPSLCLEADGENERTVIFYASVARWLESLFSGDEADAWPPMPSENILKAASWLSTLGESASGDTANKGAESQSDSAETLAAMETAFPQPSISAQNRVRTADRRVALQEAIA